MVGIVRIIGLSAQFFHICNEVSVPNDLQKVSLKRDSQLWIYVRVNFFQFHDVFYSFFNSIRVNTHCCLPTAYFLNPSVMFPFSWFWKLQVWCCNRSAAVRSFQSASSLQIPGSATTIYSKSTGTPGSTFCGATPLHHLKFVTLMSSFGTLREKWLLLNSFNACTNES